MTILCEPKFVLQDFQISRMYRAVETTTGHYALGSTHAQAISNLLGVLFLNNVPIYN